MPLETTHLVGRRWKVKMHSNNTLSPLIGCLLINGRKEEDAAAGQRYTTGQKGRNATLNEVDSAIVECDIVNEVRSMPALRGEESKDIN